MATLREAYLKNKEEAEKQVVQKTVVVEEKLELPENFVVLKEFGPDKLYFFSKAIEDFQNTAGKSLPKTSAILEAQLKTLAEATEKKNSVLAEGAFGNIVYVLSKTTQFLDKDLITILETRIFSGAKKEAEKKFNTLNEAKEIEMSLSSTSSVVKATLNETKTYESFYGSKLCDKELYEALKVDLLGLSHKDIVSLQKVVAPIPGFGIEKKKLILSEALNRELLDKVTAQFEDLEGKLGPLAAKLPSLQKAFKGANALISALVTTDKRYMRKDAEKQLARLSVAYDTLSELFQEDIPLLMRTKEFRTLEKADDTKNLGEAAKEAKVERMISSMITKAVEPKPKGIFAKLLGLVKSEPVRIIDPNTFSRELMTNLTMGDFRNLVRTGGTLQKPDPQVTAKVAQAAEVAEKTTETAKAPTAAPETTSTTAPASTPAPEAAPTTAPASATTASAEKKSKWEGDWGPSEADKDKKTQDIMAAAKEEITKRAALKKPLEYQSVVSDVLKGQNNMVATQYVKDILTALQNSGFVIGKPVR